jgi:hypothetical protein
MVSGSGVFLHTDCVLRTTRKLVLMPDRSSIEMFAALRTKEALDELDNELPQYMRTHEIGMLIFMRAHGVPELLIEGDTTVPFSVGGVSNRYASTGFNVPKHIGECNQLHRVIQSLPSNEMVPVWYTRREFELIEACRVSDYPGALKWLSAHPPTAVKHVLNTWLPIWIRDLHLEYATPLKTRKSSHPRHEH